MSGQHQPSSGHHRDGIQGRAMTTQLHRTTRDKFVNLSNMAREIRHERDREEEGKREKERESESLGRKGIGGKERNIRQ